MQIKTFVFNRIRTNTYVVWDDSGECIFIDASCESLQERERLTTFVASQKLTPVGLYNTHGHPDHVTGNAFLCRHFNIKSYLHPDDNYNLERAVEYGTNCEMNVEQPPVPLPLNNEVRFGNTTLQVLHTPGHSKGGVVFYSAAHNVMFTGDTLFAGTIGRTDLAGGDYDEIMHSIRTQLLVLPDETEVLAGHGYPTQIGKERLQNPFLIN
ncbi:MBL fold hydrolase [Bacteroidia bacterium]|nr:MBL fold hydrolase [Bacteroidia bacterium]GHT81545.1 MBL fold hydrolase [Bacteroidia bacterium]